MTLERMNQQTNRITQKEALKNAMGISQENDALVKAIEELESYGKIARAATDISREGYQEMKENLAELEKTAKDVSGRGQGRRRRRCRGHGRRLRRARARRRQAKRWRRSVWPAEPVVTGAHE